MARLSDRLPHNADGDFFVDSTCIDCDTCRMVAPAVFDRADQAEKSFVWRQPSTPDETRRALMALVACPTSSIGTISKINAAPGVDAFPELVTEDVYYCGFADESSFGARSWLIRRPEGNVLVDAPRAVKSLLRRLGDLGGVKTMFLTHRDDVGDHAVFNAELGCERVIHRDDLSPATHGCETVLEGDEPCILDESLMAIPVPGHTPGSMALLYRDKFLFTGDHLWWSARRQRLHASRAVCWHSWKDQLASVRRLLDYSFTWVLPGHGRPHRADSPEAMREAILEMLTLL